MCKTICQSSEFHETEFGLGGRDQSAPQIQYYRLRKLEKKSGRVSERCYDRFRSAEFMKLLCVEKHRNGETYVI